MKWKDLFSTQLGQPVTAKSNPKLETLYRTQYQHQHTRNNNASGKDEIPGEVWKSDALNYQFRGVCNMMLEDGDKSIVIRVKG